METGGIQCFLCGNPSVSESGDKKDCEYVEGSSVRAVEPTVLNVKPCQFLLESVLRITVDPTDSTSSGTNLCSKCSKDTTYLLELHEEMKRLELISRKLSEDLINSMMKSLVQFSRGPISNANMILEEAVQNLKRVPVQFKIYKRWRTRFVKTFNTFHVQAKSTLVHSVEDAKEIVQTGSDDVNLVDFPTPDHVMKEKHATLFHDHSYGVILKSDTMNTNAEIDNKKTNLINSTTAEDKGIEYFYMCTVCDRKFRRKATLNEHVKRGHKHSDICSKRNTHYPTQEALSRHLYGSHDAVNSSCLTCPGTSESGLCETCSATRPKHTEINLNLERKQAHMENCSTDEEGVDLEWMLPSRKSNRSEAQADKVKVDQPNEPVICHVCTHAFSKKKDLRHHLRTHTGERPFVCDYCKKSFLDKRQLRIHIRIHTGEKPYICELCGTGYSSLAGFHSHRKTHAKFRPYKCEQCDGNFRSAGQLQKHLLIHSGEKPFSCTICQKSFNRKENLRIHEYTHSVFKPHKCPQCPQSYVRASYLRNHITECHTGTNEVDDTDDSLADLTTYISEKTISDLPEDQVEIFAFDPSHSGRPHFVTAPSSAGPGGLSIIPEALFVANNGEQYIIFN